MFALSYAHRYPAQIGGIVLLDSMHPRQHNAFAGMDPLLALVPTLARTGLADLLLRSARRATRRPRRTSSSAMSTEMPAELDRAAKLTSLGDRPLAVITAGTRLRGGMVGRTE